MTFSPIYMFVHFTMVLVLQLASPRRPTYRP